MTNTIAQTVRIYGFKGQLVSLPLFQLIQFKHALALELKGININSQTKASTHVKKLLKCPKTYPLEDLHQHIADSIESINEQLGVKA